MPEETDVTVLGLGNMGSALARAFLDHGQSVTVWNRSEARTAALTKAGAKAAKSSSSAVAASPLTVACVLDYPATNSILAEAQTAAALRGRTLVQLATGNAKEARELSAWAQTHGVDYLDGGIMGFPPDIGKADTEILYAGAPTVFDTHAATLKSLAGAQRHVGHDPGNVSTVYLAIWVFYYGAQGAFLEGAALAASAGMPILEYLALTAPMFARLSEGNRVAAQRLAEGRLDGAEVSVDLMLAGADSVMDAFESVGISHEIVKGYFALLARARDAGLGAKDLASIFEVLAPAVRPSSRMSAPGQNR